MMIQMTSCGPSPTDPNLGHNSSGSPANTATFTFTGTQSPVITNTFTITNTPGAGTPTVTFTPVYPTATVPVYTNNYAASAKPNGMSVYNNQLYVSEAEPGVTQLEQYTIAAGALTGGIWGNAVITGYPTPNITPPWQGTTIVLVGPQGWANPGGAGPAGAAAVLDTTSSGAATLYTGNGGEWTGTQYGNGLLPTVGDGYSGVPFLSPKGMAVDYSNGLVYIADTGNATVDELALYGAPTYVQEWIHRWSSLMPSLPFKSPYAVTVDTNSNVWVGDTGYSPSIIEAFTSSGTTVIGSPVTTIAGCIVHGMAVSILAGPVTHIYVADAGNNKIEVYNVNNTGGTLLTAFTMPISDPESLTFVPASVAIWNSNIIVGDVGNDKIEVFVQP